MSGDNPAIVDPSVVAPLRTLLPEGDGMRWLDMAEYALTTSPLLFLFRRDLIELPWDEEIELGADTLFNLRAMERVEWVPFLARVLREYHVTPESVCHGADAHLKAERAYHPCVRQIDATGLGFKSLPGLQIVKQMLVRKRELNRRYAAAVKAGLYRNFQQFIAAGGDRAPADASLEMAGGR